MYFTINHTTHSQHTVKPGSRLAAMLDKKEIGSRLIVKIGNDRHSVFETAEDAKGFLTLLDLDGRQA